jgi:hypothetical protein
MSLQGQEAEKVLVVGLLAVPEELETVANPSTWKSSIRLGIPLS